MPVGPPPTTAIFLGFWGGETNRSTLCSNPHSGLTEHTVFQLPGPATWHLLHRRQGTTSSLRPS